jgi:hypothetical protein
MTIKLPVDVALHEQRCDFCGRWWASEQGFGICPCCARRRIDAVVEEQSRLERVCRSLRGAITRKRGTK